MARTMAWKVSNVSATREGFGAQSLSLTGGVVGVVVAVVVVDLVADLVGVAAPVVARRRRRSRYRRASTENKFRGRAGLRRRRLGRRPVQEDHRWKSWWEAD